MRNVRKFYTHVLFLIFLLPHNIDIAIFFGKYLKTFSVSDNLSDGFLDTTSTIPDNSSSTNYEILISTATAIPISLLLVLAIFVTGLVLMIRKWKNNMNISSRYTTL